MEASQQEANIEIFEIPFFVFFRWNIFRIYQ